MSCQGNEILSVVVEVTGQSREQHSTVIDWVSVFVEGRGREGERKV